MNATARESVLASFEDVRRAVEHARIQKRCGRLQFHEVRRIDDARRGYRQALVAAGAESDPALLDDSLRYLDQSIRVWSRGEDLGLNLLSLDSTDAMRMLDRLGSRGAATVRRRLADSIDWFDAADSLADPLPPNPHTHDGQPIVLGTRVFHRCRYSSGIAYEPSIVQRFTRTNVVVQAEAGLHVISHTVPTCLFAVCPSPEAISAEQAGATE